MILLAKLGNWFSRILMFVILMATPIAIGPDQANAAPNTPGTVATKAPVDQGSWVKSGAIFLVISIVGGYAWYFGVFPRLLRRANPSWPLDAWRLASYGAWITICLSTYAFKKPLGVRVIEPLLRGGPSALINYFMELVLIPLMALVGLLMIWNYRRDATNRARPT